MKPNNNSLTIDFTFIRTTEPVSREALTRSYYISHPIAFRKNQRDGHVGVTSNSL